MRSRKNHIAVLLFILTIINIVIFFYRDRFNFHKYGTYPSLYSSDTTKWNKFIHDYPEHELVEAKGIVDSLQMTNQPTSVKVLKIGIFLYNRFKKQLGKSSNQLPSSSPL